MKKMYHANHNGAHWVTQTWPSKMRSNTQRDINTRPDQEHVDQLCLSDPEWPVRSSGAPGTSNPGSECGCLPGTAELQPTPESDPVLQNHIS
ncbi:hypothetical protein BaRGS_00038428 [Batillaria attramentaria]|uniref:Uncharacterized protein n=1 Tax=Batillaria attramentaria TaxID=370345 RepID=A0ABD0J6P3_9CAEN